MKIKNIYSWLEELRRATAPKSMKQWDFNVVTVRMDQLEAVWGNVEWELCK